MKLPIAIVGFGGHGRVVAAALEASGRQILAATTLTPSAVDSSATKILLLTDAELIERYAPDQIELILGIGGITPTCSESSKWKIVQDFQQRGFRFTGFRHPAAWVAPSAIVSPTAQIHAGAIVQPGAVVRNFAIVNTLVGVDHDCVIGEHCHLGPGTSLSGDVRVGDGSHLGTGCNVIQGIELGVGCFVAAGATVVRDVAAGEYVRGVPAKTFVPRVVTG
ncbi:NeuD/PglB/VioB family sugar acetyltransferase [Aureliella helgolandensis]|uniref:Acetyltransferase EpsM n=1 Tax=Aureliella helgolandensis TaxID=2527968 RepID=A0A518GC02_9BACT|nr:NeuD/PglB/VioB family sugar acetyltransferase [Aureliella helgolandensis]QDV26142.1 Putative acetyltransferase EpsM [Aureliella helgolandensis]